MARLTRYLLRVFAAETLAIFAVAMVLVFLAQCLRLFGLVDNRGQNVLTLAGQVALTMPGIMAVVFSVCVSLGLGRALRALLRSSELGVIHANDLLGPLIRAAVLFACGGMAVVLLLSHEVQPVADRASADWTASIAAELVSYRMVPHRFTQIADGVSLVIGSRDGAGNISDFFADDTRQPDRRATYIARSAILTRDEQGFVLRLRDGALQYLYADGQFTQLAFGQYDLPMDSLSEAAANPDPLAQKTSLEIVGDGPLTADAVSTLMSRSLEALRVLGLCLMVTAIAAFPAGNRRGPRVPIEFIVLVVAFAERGISALLPSAVSGVPSGLLLLIVLSVAALLLRLDLLRPVRRIARRA